MGKSEIIYYLESIAAISLKVSETFKVNEIKKLNKYQRSMLQLTLDKGHSDFKIKTCFSQILLSHLEPNCI